MLTGASRRADGSGTLKTHLFDNPAPAEALFHGCVGASVQIERAMPTYDK